VQVLLDDVVFVARFNGYPVGYVALGQAPQGALVVDQFLVAPGHELSEVGDLLLLEAERWGANEHARALRVVVGASDWTARGFYRRRGFVLVGSDVFELSLSPC
jgi:GNAT superfamily N-acetyltransferase